VCVCIGGQPVAEAAGGDGARAHHEPDLHPLVRNIIYIYIIVYGTLHIHMYIVCCATYMHIVYCALWTEGQTPRR
jgi:hypothetical protein